jgi:hypothetical protein
MTDKNSHPQPELPRKRGRPRKPRAEVPPKVRKRKPSSETIVGRARAAAMLSVPDEDIGINTGGRPTKYRDEFARIAKAMCRLGATDADLAEEFCVDIDTIRNWQSKHPRFAKALVLGKEPADERVARAFYKRAVGYSYQSQKIMQYEGSPVIVPFKEHVPPDAGAAYNWLVNRRREEWQSRSAIEHTGRNGRPLSEELGTTPAALLETARWIADRLAAAQSVPTTIDITPTKALAGPPDDDNA